MTGRVLSHYRILEKLGEGGMGVVYKARDMRLDRIVALKMLPTGVVSNPERRRRFIQEARAASALNHPNIITVHEIDAADGADFIAMEFVSGKTLEKFIGRNYLPLGQALKYGIQIAAALAAAHAAGIVHHDLKPGNIMVTETGLVKVLDFGLAKLTEAFVPGQDEVTRTLDLRIAEGAIAGTAAYMSPEQAEGKPVDTRSDIFSFGSVLYEMITGRRAFLGGTTASTLAAILRGEPEPARSLRKDLPQEVEQLIVRCLRKDPDRRIQHMDEVKLVLEDLESGQPPAVTAPRRIARPGILAAVLVVAVLVAGVAWFSRHRKVDPAAPMKALLLTTYPGSEWSPSLSPDGSQVAFAWNGKQQDNFDIYVQLVSGGEPLRLTTNPAMDLLPAWSPDGNQIAFARGNSVFLISPLGGPERNAAPSTTFLLYGGLSQLAWTPDAKSLALSHRSSEAEPFSIWLVSIATGQKRKLTSPPRQVVGDHFPAISPNGKQLAFIRLATTSSADLYVAPIDGGEALRLTGDNSQIRGVTWAPDGQELVFGSNRGGSFNLWRIPAAASHATEPSRVLAAGPGAMFPVISRGRPTRLAYEHVLIDVNIWRANIEASRRAATSASELIASTQTDESPRFSPDGSRIVFVSNRTGSSEIWVCNSDGTNSTRLTSLYSHSGSPTWSADGKQIAFDSMFGPYREIVVVDVAGGAPRRLTAEVMQQWRPSYSRDGRWIYFGSDRSGSPQIWKLPREGGSAVQVTNSGGYEAIESLDGKTLYYAKKSPSELWSVPVSGGEETLVLRPVLTGYWAVADRGIHFLDFSRQAALMQGAAHSAVPIMFYDFSTRHTTQAGLAEKAVNWEVPGFSVTRDGSAVLYLRINREDADLVLIDDFR